MGRAARIAVCGSGTTCTTTVTQSAPGQHSYIAYVAALSGALPPPDVRATGILNAAGLVLGSDSEVVDCGHLGKVAHQSPAAGASVAAGTAVSVTHGVQPTPPAECP